MRQILLISLFLLLIGNVRAQDVAMQPVDSLNKLLAATPRNDYPRIIELLDSLYEIYSLNDLPLALNTARHQLVVAEKGGIADKVADAAGKMGYTLYMQGHNDSALYFMNRALIIYNETQQQEEIATTRNNIANIYRITAQYDSAMVIYNENLDYYISIDDETKVAQILANIGSLYYTAGNQEKAKEYTLKSIETQRKINDPRSLAISLVNMSVFSLNDNEFEDGIRYGDEAIAILKEIDQNYYAAALIRTGYCYYCTGQEGKALEYTDEAIDIYEKNDNIRGLLEAYRTQGDYLMEMGRYAEARGYGLKALERADTTNRLDLRLTYDLLKRAAIWLNIPEEAENYSQLQIDMKEADLNDEWAARISEAEAKYDTDRKEMQIQTLIARKKLQLVLIVSLLVVLGAGAAAAWFFAKNQKQKRQIDQQRINELEKEKQLTATMSLLEGENIERRRLSRDLHDGLGGMLSVAKLKISNMKGSLTIPEDQVSSFNAAIDLLDGSIRELRRVAHNLMPESLVKYGLNNALTDFCGSTGKVSYHFYGNERRVDNKVEVAVYRIVSELVNNALKHSGADTINVQLIMESDRVSVVVEDNGKGFDSKVEEEKEGNGLKNVRSRVSSLGGKLEIISSPGKGTEVNVEFNC